MPSIHLENLSSFGRLAVKLDTDFMELSRLSGQLERLDIESDSGLEHAIKLLSQFAQRAQDISEGMQEFSGSLLEARQRSEAATKIIEERALRVQQRKQQQDQLQQKLNQLEQSVKAANARLGGFRKEGKGAMSDEERSEFKEELQRLTQSFASFIETAQAVKDEAGRLKFKRLEREAQSIRGTLQSLIRKIETAVTK